MGSSGPHPPETAAGAPGAGVARKMVCWICGGDLIFNCVRVRSGTLVLDLYCRRCAVPRTMSLHLQPGDDDRLFSDGGKHGRG